MENKQGLHHGVTVAQPNEFEVRHRPSIITHLPPLSAHEPAFSERPKILERGSFTKAAPIKEKRHFRKVSDSIANNYSPNARHLTASVIYETTKLAYSVEETYFLSPRKPAATKSPSPEEALCGLDYRRNSTGLLDVSLPPYTIHQDGSQTDRLPINHHKEFKGQTVLPPINGFSAVPPSEVDYIGSMQNGEGTRSVKL
ncbi:uncharacterized protein [Haliotis asinina]|uniref:uncharacterized protein n=1 Tax=Haliotis asinina TaxID=109174 RepID=UPI003531BA9D